ncbi:hypothetical protein DFH94DRAFT_303396 [Russula ochroleuca]|jgi:hypothetical protein|uniref:Uncharacterized protein n=1 Tax=Russula ochroleuca TaxID=152965 RepID=A0A9P5TBE4_9AGAM|nr:hypothetical protein DFH94DRAFT_303396 [Russula ochroleuca]
MRALFCVLFDLNHSYSTPSSYAQCSQVASEVQQQGYSITHMNFRSCMHGTHTLRTPGEALPYLSLVCWHNFTYKDGLFRFHDGIVRTDCPMCRFSPSPHASRKSFASLTDITREIASPQPHDLDACTVCPAAGRGWRLSGRYAFLVPPFVDLLSSLCPERILAGSTFTGAISFSSFWSAGATDNHK